MGLLLDLVCRGFRFDLVRVLIWPCEGGQKGRVGLESARAQDFGDLVQTVALLVMAHKRSY